MRKQIRSRVAQLTEAILMPNKNRWTVEKRPAERIFAVLSAFAALAVFAAAAPLAAQTAGPVASVKVVAAQQPRCAAAGR
jgi:phosphate/sulfate permease